MKLCQIISVLALSFLITSCETPSNFMNLQKDKDEITLIKEEIHNNNEEKLEKVATFAAGTDYSLDKIKDPSVEVTTAKDLNNRVISIAGNPNITEYERIKEMVDLLNSELNSERQKGEKLLSEKDSEIIRLEVALEDINSRYDEEIKNFEEKSLIIAAKADKLQVTVDNVNSYMGLGGVVYGLKLFVKNSLLWITLFVGLFILLRLFAGTNPIIGAIFSIFEHIAAMLIRSIKAIVPKSLEFSNHIESKLFDKYKHTLTKIIMLIMIKNYF